MKNNKITNKEFFRAHQQSDTVVIFIHGILEKPKQFRQLAALSYKEGYSVAILLLPGHGGSGEAFIRTHLYKWVDYVNSRIAYYKRRYPHVIIVGHSMGGLLGLGYCTKWPKHIQRAVIVDMPVWVHLWPRVLVGAIKIARGSIKPNERYVLSEYQAIGVRGASFAIYLRWIPRYMDLFTLMGYVNKRLERLSMPILIVQAKKDEFVHLYSAKRLGKVLKNSQIMYLRDSGHFCYNEDDLYLLEKVFVHFLRENKHAKTPVN